MESEGTVCVPVAVSLFESQAFICVFQGVLCYLWFHSNSLHTFSQFLRIMKIMLSTITVFFTFKL